MFVHLLAPDLVARIRNWDDLKRWERRDTAHVLRHLGLSYREIGTIVRVSKATLSVWCRDIPLLSFSNSDPHLIRLFIAWARRYLSVGADGFTVRLHLHDGQDEDERREFWMSVTGLPIECFPKSFIKPEGSGHRKNVLYNGTALVRVRRSSELLHRVKGWIESVADTGSTLG
jgi:hypothetical protein